MTYNVISFVNPLYKRYVTPQLLKPDVVRLRLCEGMENIPQPALPTGRLTTKDSIS